MPPSTRLGDIGSGHACHFPPTPSIEASPDVNIDGIPAVRQGDAYAPHACPTCPAPPHPRSLSGGSGSVYINGKPAAGSVILSPAEVLPVQDQTQYSSVIDPIDHFILLEPDQAAPPSQ